MLGFSTTNNEAEYEALLEGMSMVQKVGGKAIKNVFALKTDCWPSRGRARSQK